METRSLSGTAPGVHDIESIPGKVAKFVVVHVGEIVYFDIDGIDNSDNTAESKIQRGRDGPIKFSASVVYDVDKETN